MKDQNKITPGPWEWWTSNSFKRLTGADRKDGGVLTASGMYPQTFPTVVVSDADARLIAAAPDLLAALEFMLDRFEGRTGNLFSQRLACTKAKEAIAKAKGEQA